MPMISIAGLLASPQAIPEGELGESPIPGGVAAVVRFFLSFPQPLQIAGLVAGAIAFVLAAVWAWRRRAAIWSWFTSQPRIVYAAMAAAVVAGIVAATAVGISGWNYVEHDNAFCTGCHVMRPAYVRFTESEHSELECHDCHQQPVTASMRQLYLWVAERPEEIGPHAPVPNDVCVTCHVQADPDDTWEAIAEMQGHRLHLDSDSAALADIQCVTCHGQALHEFVPSAETCGQSDCHSTGETEIVLGEMAGAETSFHCVTCHEFTAPLEEQERVGGPGGERVPMLPAMEDCRSCHQMEQVIADLELTGDPHETSCGWCHNPHEQTEPEDTWQTCTGSGCHTDPASLTAFHRGTHGGEILQDCQSCHMPHTWVEQGDNCEGCHEDLS